MCQSKSQGGRRCDAHNFTKHARTLLQSQVRYHQSKDHQHQADRAREVLADLDSARAQYGDIVTPLNFTVPASVQRVFTALRDQGYNPLIVGGSVRDAISGDAPKDIDVEVYGAKIDDVVTCLRRQRLRVDEVGKAFGVLKTTLADGVDLDISVPRRENHVGAGHRGFSVDTDAQMSVQEASSRRDFTVNAISFDAQYKVAVDPHGGREDLKNGVLRHVSDAFAEDPLRVLRGFQFSARYGMSMHPETIALCSSLVSQASDLPAERVRAEWHKFYSKGNRPDLGLANLHDTGWDATIAGLEAHNTPLTRDRALRAAQRASDRQIPAAERTVLLAGTIAQDMSDQDARAFVNATVEGAVLQRQAYGLSRARGLGTHSYSDGDIRRWSRQLSSSYTTPAQWYEREFAKQLDPHGDHNAVDSPESHFMMYYSATVLGVENGPQPDLLQGRHIKELTDRAPGPWMGKLLKKAQSAQDEGDFSTLEEAIAWVRPRLSE